MKTKRHVLHLMVVFALYSFLGWFVFKWDVYQIIFVCTAYAFGYGNRGMFDELEEEK